MKKTWTKAELQASRGCYTEEQIETLWNGGRGESVTIIEIMESSVTITDKRWFLFNKGGMTLVQKKQFALICARVVLPIYEDKYPDDKRVRDCLDGIEKFNRGEISRDALLDLRRAAYAAYAAAADAAADADAAAAYAAAAAAAADAAAAYAAAAADGKATYSQRLKEAFIEFVNNNE